VDQVKETRCPKYMDNKSAIVDRIRMTLTKEAAESDSNGPT
jgi:hypothetical protein